MSREKLQAVPCEIEITVKSKVGNDEPMEFVLRERSKSVAEHTVKIFEHFNGMQASQAALASAAGLPVTIEEIKKLFGLK